MEGANRCTARRSPSVRQPHVPSNSSSSCHLPKHSQTQKIAPGRLQVEQEVGIMFREGSQASAVLGAPDVQLKPSRKSSISTPSQRTCSGGYIGVGERGTYPPATVAFCLGPSAAVRTDPKKTFRFLWWYLSRVPALHSTPFPNSPNSFQRKRQGTRTHRNYEVNIEICL